MASATYPGSAGLIKLAILFQYLRIYDKQSRFRKATILTIVVVALWSLVYSILAWIPTIPVYAYWDISVPASRYAFGSIYVEPFVAIYTSLTATNVLMDLVIQSLAVPLFLRNSKAESKCSRWSLFCLFSIGSV